MSNLVLVKRRISSVKNTRQITKAMELVAASKMRKAQAAARAGRAYQESAYSLLHRLNEVIEVKSTPLFRPRKINTRTYVLITSNRGLAGAYNANAVRMLTKRAKEDRAVGIKVAVIAVGLKGSQIMRRVKDVDLVASFPAFEGIPGANEIRPVLDLVLAHYTSHESDAIEIIYTKLVSNLSQIASTLAVLPATYDDTRSADTSLVGVTFEPAVEDVLVSVTQRLLEAQLWQAILESNASEHSMRMLAMKNATDNATDLIDDLTLAYNNSRQSSITQEIAEISGGAEAMKETA